MNMVRPGQLIDSSPYLSQLDFSQFQLRVSTDRYHDEALHKQERDALWMRVWQPVARADDLSEAGDWQEYKLFDQSFIIVRGRDGVVRGFVNACRHRGNAVCEGKGRSARFQCPYHNWSYGLDGKLLAVAKPDYDGPVEEFVGRKEDLGLVQVPVECFAGFVFLNPDPEAPPLMDYLGEVADLLAPYRMEEMVPVGLNTREAIDSNWKVVMDAFQEGYHVQAVHPELVPLMDESKERYRFIGDHSIATAPFGTANLTDLDGDQQAEAVRGLTAPFPGMAKVLPRFDQLVDACRGADGKPVFTDAVNPRTLLQQATRETLTESGLDVSALTDIQMSDNQFHVGFPNLFITIRAGEATVITAVPHPGGDPGRCIWHAASYQWLPPEVRSAQRAPLIDIAEGEHQPYFLALEQDYVQLQRQQRGLRNRGLKEMVLTRQEVRLAHFHAAVDRWVKGEASQ